MKVQLTLYGAEMTGLDSSPEEIARTFTTWGEFGQGVHAADGCAEDAHRTRWSGHVGDVEGEGPRAGLQRLRPVLMPGGGLTQAFEQLVEFLGVVLGLAQRGCGADGLQPLSGVGFADG